MSKNITLMGASYSDVPSVLLPQTGGGNAQFFDVSDTTAAAADVATGKYFYTSAGVRTQGTNSGGGGGSNWTLLTSKEFTINQTSTSNTSIGNIDLTLADYSDVNTVLWVHIRDKAGKRNGYYYGSDALFFHFQLANGSTNSLTVRPVITFTVSSSGSYSGAATAYGVYPYRLYYTQSNHYVQIYARYSSSSTLTINGTFKCDVYKLTMPTGVSLFT